MRDYKTASREYKLGWAGKSPYDMDKWTNSAIADFNAGKADRAKRRKQIARRDTVEDIAVAVMAIFAVIFGTIFTVLIWTLVVALPFILVLLAAKVIL